MKTSDVSLAITFAGSLIVSAPAAFAQPPGPSQPPAASSWTVMQDGVVYGLFNHQGSPRGGDEFVLPNWWMGVMTRQAGRHVLGLNAMLSLDAATVGKAGYREIFQTGEALDGQPIVDRQHPHDFFMQLAATWRLTFGSSAIVVSGGPSGEPTLGPVAFMHRPSAAGLVLAPLGHHTFDATHVSFGVVAVAIERTTFGVEGSVFNGREPDDNRWDFDFGRLDSVAGRVWLRPKPGWEAQISTGHLREPEELDPGDVQRTTTSLSWFRTAGRDFRAVTAGYGVNVAHGDLRHGAFGELTFIKGSTGWSGRLEVQQVETDVLLGHDDHHDEPATVTALTLGAERKLFEWRGFEGALTGHVTLYAVPGVLEPEYGNTPVSFQALFRLRLPTGSMGRMWNARMSQGHVMPAGHVHKGP